MLNPFKFRVWQRHFNVLCFNHIAIDECKNLHQAYFDAYSQEYEDPPFAFFIRNRVYRVAMNTALALVGSHTYEDMIECLVCRPIVVKLDRETMLAVIKDCTGLNYGNIVNDVDQYEEMINSCVQKVSSVQENLQLHCLMREDVKIADDAMYDFLNQIALGTSDILVKSYLIGELLNRLAHRTYILTYFLKTAHNHTTQHMCTVSTFTAALEGDALKSNLIAMLALKSKNFCLTVGEHVACMNQQGRLSIDGNENLPDWQLHFFYSRCLSEIAYDLSIALPINSKQFGSWYDEQVADGPHNKLLRGDLYVSSACNMVVSEDAKFAYYHKCEEPFYVVWCTGIPPCVCTDVDAWNKTVRGAHQYLTNLLAPYCSKADLENVVESIITYYDIYMSK